MALSQAYQLRKRAENEKLSETIQETLKEFEEEEEREKPLPGRKISLGAAQVAMARSANMSLPEYVKEGLEQGWLKYDDEIVKEPEETEGTDVDAVLDSRAQDYGKFIDGAEIMQMLKRLVHNYIEDRSTPLAFDQREAIDMIIHKLGRIINGNPDKVDSWVDIAGYATLVADRLEGNAR